MATQQPPSSITKLLGNPPPPGKPSAPPPVYPADITNLLNPTGAATTTAKSDRPSRKHICTDGGGCCRPSGRHPFGMWWDFRHTDYAAREIVAVSEKGMIKIYVGDGDTASGGYMMARLTRRVGYVDLLFSCQKCGMRTQHKFVPKEIATAVAQNRNAPLCQRPDCIDFQNQFISIWV